MNEQRWRLNEKDSIRVASTWTILNRENVVYSRDGGWDWKADRADKDIKDAVNIWVRLKPPTSKHSRSTSNMQRALKRRSAFDLCECNALDDR